jgi:hypothetical protein
MPRKPPALAVESVNKQPERKTDAFPPVVEKNSSYCKNSCDCSENFEENHFFLSFLR